MYGIYHTYVDVFHMYGICMVYVWYILGYTIHMYSNGYTMYIQLEGYTWSRVYPDSIYMTYLCISMVYVFMDIHGISLDILGYP